MGKNKFKIKASRKRKYSDDDSDYAEEAQDQGGSTVVPAAAERHVRLLFSCWLYTSLVYALVEFLTTVLS